MQNLGLDISNFGDSELLREIQWRLDATDFDDINECELLFEDTNPISATLTIKGDATELKSVIEEYAEMPDNEFGIYVPINKLMNLFVGSNLKYYKGNVLFVNEEDGALIITVEMNNSSYPFKYAIERRYPTLEVMVDD